MSSLASYGDKLKVKLRTRKNFTPSNSISTAEGTAPTINSSVRSRLFDRERLNLESHQLICCDTNTQSGITEDITLSELREIIDYTKLFTNVKSCKHYLEETQPVVSFLICSNDISQQLIPEIHHLHNVRSIYVYSSNVDHRQQWSSEYAKVKHVYTDRQSLLQALDSDVKKYLEKEKDGLFGNFDKQNRTTESGSASWWVTFMDALCYLPYPKETCHQRLVAELRNYYDGKTEELRVINEFERDYTAEKAIWWYTRDTFFFRLINRANRQHNVRVMFAFGYYIRDVFLQLKKEHETFKVINADNVQVKVFRGQIMSEDEVDTLKSAYMVRLTTFLSTSLDRRLALSFLPPVSSVAIGHVRVVIEINLNAHFNSKPFGNIAHLSEFSGESEVLMMIGTFLRVRQTYFSEEEKLVKSIMTLEKDYILPFDNSYMGLKKCVSIIAAEVCKQAPEEEINTIFDELDELFPSERVWLRAERYRALGGCQEGYGRENYRWALQYYKQALGIWQRYPHNNGVEVASLHLDISRLYNDHLDEEELTQEHYQSAITVCKTTLSHAPDDERQKAALYQILSAVYLDKAKMNDQTDDRKTALHYEQLRLQALVKIGSPTDRELGLCYTSIAELQEEMGLFDEALANYKETAKMHLGRNDTEPLSRAYQCISRLYEDNFNDLPSALKYRLLKHDAMVQSSEILPFHDCQEIEDRKHCVIQSHIQLADIHLKLRDFEAARMSLAAAKQLYEDMDWQKQAKQIEEQLSDIVRLEQNSK